MESLSRFFGALLISLLVVFLLFGVGIVAAHDQGEEEGIILCSPHLQTVEVGETASFSVQALVGSDDRYYVWHAPAGNPDVAEGQKLDNFDTVYSDPGEYTVSVSSMVAGNDVSYCHVTVVQHSEENPGEIPTVVLEKVAEDLGTNEFGTHVKYTISWRVDGGDISDLVISDTLPDWTDGIVSSITPASTPVLATGQLNYIDPIMNPANNRTITWDFDGELEGATGTVSFTLETWNNEICSVTNTATASFIFGTGNHPGSATATSNTINVPDDHCQSPTTATVSAVKIVCDSEADLPNWGAGGEDITSTTASTFLASHPNCELTPWTFQWAASGTANPGDNTGAAGEAWTSFTSTTTVPAGSLVWVREIWNDNYIPFTGESIYHPDSAEFYCSNSVLNYDNYDFIDPVLAGSTYHCIGFNVLKNVVGHPECSDGVDNADTEDELVDSNDPGCHSDGNAGNTESYVPTDNDETNSQGGGGGHTPECSDDVDNSDPEDTLVDEADPGCHSDEDVNNSESYNPNDDSETNTDGTGGGETQCSDGIDNADPEDELIDSQDPGCHTDNNATDGDDSYNPDDDNETDESDNNGGGGGGGGGSSHRSSGSSRRSSGGKVLGAENSCGIHVDKYLRIGYANDVATVIKVQNFLNFYLDTNLAVDGIYGVQTEAAVREFQRLRADNVLKPWDINESTGIFYLTTETEVNNIMCPELEIPIPNPLINWSINPYVVLPPAIIA